MESSRQTSCGGSTQKESAAATTMASLQKLEDRCCDLAGMVEDRLSLVMSPPMPECETNAKEPVEPIPPLFEDMRSRINAIHYSLSRIDTCMRRLEL